MIDFSDAYLQAEKAMKNALAHAALHDWFQAETEACRAQDHITEFRKAIRREIYPQPHPEPAQSP